MDLDGLKRLWWIARSQKSGEERIATSADGATSRKMIGKFGIGKLASCAVGNRLAHLCRQGAQYLLVSVDYGEAPKLTDSDDRQERGFSTPVRSLDESTAREFVESLFRATPSDLGRLLARYRWTIAIIDDLRENVALTQGRLGWILGNGMPTRPDFRVRVNGLQVRPAIEGSAFEDWDYSSSALVTSLQSQWTSAAREGLVAGHVEFGSYADLANVDPRDGNNSALAHYAEIPGLGKTAVRLRLFSESLRKGRLADHGRSEGFFVYVRERLLNPDDAKRLLPDPSFGAFNRMQATIWADGLDAELLADRERLQRSGPATVALALVQQAVYLAARNRLEQYDDERQKDSQEATTLPAESREFFRQPLTALVLRHRTLAW
jgi:hypothetical protein